MTKSINRPFKNEVGSKYGAPMGRPSDTLDPDSESILFTNVPMFDGCYDEGGAYWGSGRLFYVQDEHGSGRFERNTRKKDLESEFPNAKVEFQQTTWNLYWHTHECNDSECESSSSPSEYEDSAMCDCGAHIEESMIYHTETEIVEYDGIL